MENESMTLPKEVMVKYMQSIFVETGTFDGRTVQMALDCGCMVVYSIETDNGLFSEVSVRFRGNSHVHLFHGDSLDCLGFILQEIKERKALIWLDAHIQDSYEWGKVAVPIIKELNIFASADYLQHTIMMDDMRLAGNAYGWQGISYQNITDAVLNINKDYQLCLEDSKVAAADILVAHI
jgi:hypothetical protein